MKKNKSSSKNGSKAEATSPAPGGGWARWLVWFIVIVLVAEFLNALRPPKDKTFAISQFAELPLTFNGRIQPMDSLARNSLLQIRKNTDVPLEGNAANGAWGEWEKIRGGGQLTERNWYQFSKHPKKLKPAEWLLEVMSAPDRANDRYVFEADHPELVSLLKLDGKGVDRSGLRYFTFNELRSSTDEAGKDPLRSEAERASKVDATHRNAFDRAVLQLYNALSLYMRLQATIQPPNTQDFTKDLDDYLASIKPGRDAIIAQQAGQKHDEEALNRLLGHAEKYDIMNKMEPPLVVPPQEGQDPTQWQRTGLALMNTARGEPFQESIRLYAQMATAYRTGDVARFNETVKDYKRFLESRGFGVQVKKGEQEFLFNRMVAFKRTMYMYIVAFIFVLVYWFNFNNTWRRGAFWLVLIGGIIHSVALIMRMVLEGRPPVTNLYSSAIFIGWGSVVLGLILERVHRNGIGLAVASSIGFVTLIIAHQLSLSGDTMEMMRAVLDTNFWLATHVVVITLGYASTFVAGFLAILYVIRGVFTKSLDQDTAKSFARMVYAIVCFATLFSFVGTVLGGIWADQSWGRFWGWDPKENGALVIVLWNALILHARWGGLVRERGLMNLAIFGNVVTAWSWFGVNMLGIGLHSYGFMDQAFHWLIISVGACLVLIANGLLPLGQWASFKSEGAISLWRYIVSGVSVILLGLHIVFLERNNASACMVAFYAEIALFFLCMFLNLLPEKSGPDSNSGAEVPQPA